MKDPAAANSVQLAQLNLYTAPDTPDMPPEPLSHAVSILHTAATRLDEASAAAHVKAVDTLLLVLANVLQHPEEAKYRTLKSSNVRVQGMLSCGDHFAAILKAVGQPSGHLCTLPANWQIQKLVHCRLMRYSTWCCSIPECYGRLPHATCVTA